MKNSKINLNFQEKVWLETIAYFSSILLENFQLIEKLLENIESYRDRSILDANGYPLWLSRLMFSLSEKERRSLSIDLHDSVLQDQLQLLREVEKITGEVQSPSYRSDLLKLQESMLDNIHLVRETCNELRPPFLNEMGIIQSIQNLVDKTKLQCTFILTCELDSSIKRLGKEVELSLYRVVQELLNNAMKHSQATKVDLSLCEYDKTLTLNYHDNGIGFDTMKLNNSFKTMGIFGIRERVRILDGRIEIKSVQGQGVHVNIKVERDNNSD